MSTVKHDWPPRHRLTVTDYHRMAEMGLLAPDARVELIDGQIIDMAPIGNPHQAAVDRLTQLLVQSTAGLAIIRTQGSVRIEAYSEPQPDIALLAPRTDFYSSRPATAADTLLIIEVSDSTLRYDRNVKVPLYARCGIPEVWIVDVQGKELLTFHSPSGDDYAGAASTTTPGVTGIRTLPGVVVDLSELLKF